MILATFTDVISTDSEDSEDSDVVALDENGHVPSKAYGWLYTGSHNFTPSAWGTLSGSGFTPVLNACVLSPSSDRGPVG